MRANQRIESGELPAQEIVEGLFLAVGGAFLLTPGFITDTLGFMFLIGPIRRYIVRTLIKSGKLAMFQSGAQSQFFYTQNSRGNADDGNTFEGEYEKDVGPDNDQNKLDKN